jgi:CRISPR-associated endonuclease/helicase Cas3
MAPLNGRPPWAKLRRADEKVARREERPTAGPIVAWRSLVDHSADVAAMFRALLVTPGTRARLEQLSSLSALSDATISRLTVLAALHDFGKANRGFQARWHPRAPSIGHVKEAMVALCDPHISCRLVNSLPLQEGDRWFGPGSLAMAIGHHGYPVSLTPERDDKALWAVVDGNDPAASLAPLGVAIRYWVPEAFASNSAVQIKPRGWHLLSGLLTLADWIASDETFFPLAPVGEAEIGLARFQQSNARARGILQHIGFDPRRPRDYLVALPSFTSISSHPPRPIQLAAGEVENEAHTRRIRA